MDMDQRWVTRNPRAMLDSFHWFHGEAFELIVEDLLHATRSSRKASASSLTGWPL
jgi:hypothetical protein